MAVRERQKRVVGLEADGYQPSMVSDDGKVFFCEILREGQWSGINLVSAAHTGCELPHRERIVFPTRAVLLAANHFYRTTDTQGLIRRGDALVLAIPATMLVEAVFTPEKFEPYSNERIGFLEDWDEVQAGTWRIDLLDWKPTGDEVLDRIGVRPEEFKVEQLLTYFYERFHRHFGYEYPRDYFRDRTCLQNLLAWYRDQSVGLLRYLFEVRGGMVQGEVVSTNVFARNCRWKADEVYNAFRVHERESAGAAQRNDELRGLISDWAAK